MALIEEIPKNEKWFNLDGKDFLIFWQIFRAKYLQKKWNESNY